jgi:protocatechuate 4,5-dioxygenase, alpha chain
MKGYWLNRAFHDLRFPSNRDAMRANLVEYLKGYPVSDEEIQLVVRGDWAGAVDAGASIYTLTKVGATLDVSLIAMGAQMRGESIEEFTAFLDEQNKRCSSFAVTPTPREEH